MSDAKAKIDAAMKKRDEQIPKEWRLKTDKLPQDSTGLLKESGILSSKELELIELPAHALAKAIADKKYTAVEATTAYCKAAAIAQQATNCLIELFADEALAAAKKLDEFQKKEGKTMGALHGVPVSIKDHIDVKGHDSPSGFLSLVGKMVAKEDSHPVKILRAAGAVLYCKTTNCQSIMHLETSGYFGVTVNPYNNKLSAGGSSGGEGALVGMKGSPMGVGTDVGGSIRSPAAACGIYSFKPSAARVPYDGVNVLILPDGWHGVQSTQGPMTRNVDDLELYMKVMLAARPWNSEPGVEVKEWREYSNPKRVIRIGVMRDNGVVKPVAPITRAIETAIYKLQASGKFEVVDYEPFKSKEAWDLLKQLYQPDGGNTVMQHLTNSGEEVKALTDWILDQSGNKGRQLSAEELFKLVAQRDEFRTQLAKHWHSQPIDCILTPVGPTPAPAHGTAKYWGYTCYWNLANYPAAVFPTGLFVDPAKDAKDKSYEPRNESEATIWDSYDAETSKGAPICLQVVGYIGHEEETMYALKQVDAVMRGQKTEDGK